MIFDGDLLVRVSSRVALVLVLLGIAVALVRLVRGPDAADRVVAADLIAVLVVAFLAAFAVHAEETSFLDVAIAYALVAFLGTVALARYLERTPSRRGRTVDARGENPLGTAPAKKGEGEDKGAGETEWR
jgi:multicomponent Na+:H+ antiporter subunit F